MAKLAKPRAKRVKVVESVPVVEPEATGWEAVPEAVPEALVEPSSGPEPEPEPVPAPARSRPMLFQP